MKKLYLLRHAKSDYPAGVDDHERPLNTRGRNDSLKMGKYLKENNILPQKIISSDAKRTTETINNIIKSAAIDIKAEFTSGLYLATPGEMLKQIAKTSEDIESLMVVSHNPGTEQLAKILTRSGTPEAISLIKLKYPTCGLTILTINAESWEKIEPACAFMEDFIVPKII